MTEPVTYVQWMALRSIDRDKDGTLTWGGTLRTSLFDKHYVVLIDDKLTITSTGYQAIEDGIQKFHNRKRRTQGNKP
jgi:hypothetical protein